MTEAAILSADEILRTKIGFKQKTLLVPDWGSSVVIRSLSLGARYDIAERAVREGRKVDNRLFTVLTLVHGIVNPVLTEEQAGKIVDGGTPEAVELLSQEIWGLSGVQESTAKNGSPRERS